MNKKLILLFTALQLSTSSFGMFCPENCVPFYAKDAASPEWQLFCAARDNDKEKTKMLLAQGVDPRSVIKYIDSWGDAQETSLLNSVLDQPDKAAIIKLFIKHDTTHPATPFFADVKDMLAFYASICKSEKKQILDKKQSLLCALWLFKQPELSEIPTEIRVRIFDLLLDELVKSHMNLINEPLDYIQQRCRLPIKNFNPDNPESLLCKEVKKNICEILFAPQEK